MSGCTAWQDQQRAAIADALARGKRAQRFGARRVPPSESVDRLWRRHLAVIEADRGWICEHLTGSPTVEYAVAWRPGVAVCEACIHWLACHEDEDWKCDLCERRVGEVVFMLAAVGSTLFQYSTCVDCAPEHVVNAARQIGRTSPNEAG